LDRVAILQLGAGDGYVFVVGDGGAGGEGDSQAVDGELGLGGDAFVQVLGAALDVDFGLLGQVADWLACEVLC
jgi:hypothetical protein